jgi:hypothetical protein
MGEIIKQNASARGGVPSRVIHIVVAGLVPAIHVLLAE